MTGQAGSEPCPRQDEGGEIWHFRTPLVINRFEVPPQQPPRWASKREWSLSLHTVSMDLPRKRQKGFSLAGGIWGRGFQKSRG